jgi:transcriptional regulator with XRE-family HTH domain
MVLEKQAEKEVYVRLGRRIRRRREALGMSQETLADQISLSVARVRACEQGRYVIRITLIAALAKALGVPESYLLHDEEAGHWVKDAKGKGGMPFSSHRPRKRRAADLAALDIHIGQRLRWRRQVLGLSQEALGRKLGVTFQQIQKYENGANSLSTRRLYQLMHILCVPLTFFFDGFVDTSTPRDMTFSSDTQVGPPEKLNLALLRACLQIETSEVKLAVMRLIKALAERPLASSQIKDGLRTGHSIGSASGETDAVSCQDGGQRAG